MRLLNILMIAVHWTNRNLIRSPETQAWADERDMLKAQRLEREARMGKAEWL